MRWPWQSHTTRPVTSPGRVRAPMARPVKAEAAVPLTCVGCGARLGLDPEDEPAGEGHGRPICGECNRARNFDALLEGGELR